MKRKVLAVLLAASMMGTLGACGSSDSGKQTDAKTDDSSSTETTDSGEASADSSDGSFDGVKIEVDIEDSIQGDQNTLDCFNKLIDEFSQQTGAEVEVVQNGSDHENIMKTRMASQDMPDMFVTHGWSTLRYNDFCEDLSGEEWVSRLDDAVKAVITDEMQMCWKQMILILMRSRHGMISRLPVRNWKQTEQLHWLSQERTEVH